MVGGWLEALFFFFFLFFFLTFLKDLFKENLKDKRPPEKYLYNTLRLPQLLVQQEVF